MVCQQTGEFYSTRLDVATTYLRPNSDFFVGGASLDRPLDPMLAYALDFLVC